MLPRNIDPDLDLDPRSTGEEELDPRMTGEARLDPRSDPDETVVPSGDDRALDGISEPQPRVSSPQDRFEPNGGNSGGGSSGGGSLF